MYCSSKEQLHRWGPLRQHCRNQAYASPSVAATPDTGPFNQSLARPTMRAGCVLQVSDADYLAAVLPISLVKAAVISVASAPTI